MSDHSTPEEGDVVALVRGLLKDMAGTPVTRLELRHGDLRVQLRRVPGMVAHPSMSSHSHMPAQATRPDHWQAVEAPLTGIFYARPSPDDAYYVSLESHVEPDTVVGLIEAMKMFNEVTANMHGIVREIVAENGALIEAGQPLLYVEPGNAVQRPAIDGV